MLNGIAPILVFHFPTIVTGSPTFNALAGVPLIGNLLTDNFGIPIPLYLDEQLTGLYVDSESKAIDIDTETRQRYDGKPPDVTQRGLNNLVTVNLIAQKDSTLLSVLLALNDQVFQQLVTQKYSITYLNGPTTIFNGLLHGFSSSQGSDDDLIRIVLQISKSNQKDTKEDKVTFPLPKVTGATPVAVGG